MSYSQEKFETYDTIRVYRTTFSSSVGNYLLASFDCARDNNRFIPQVFIVHYDTLTGNWGGGASINLGYTAGQYGDWLTGSAGGAGILDVSSRLTNNMTIIQFSNATANGNNKFAISGSQQVYMRWNTTNTLGTITGSAILVGHESYGVNNVIL